MDKGSRLFLHKVKVFFTAWSRRTSEEVTFEERLTGKVGGEVEGKAGNAV